MLNGVIRRHNTIYSVEVYKMIEKASCDFFLFNMCICSSSENEFSFVCERDAENSKREREIGGEGETVRNFVIIFVRIEWFRMRKFFRWMVQTHIQKPYHCTSPFNYKVCTIMKNAFFSNSYKFSSSLHKILSIQINFNACEFNINKTRIHTIFYIGVLILWYLCYSFSHRKYIHLGKIWWLIWKD